MGERGHALPRDEYGELRDCVEDVIGGSRVRGGYSDG